MPRLVGQMMVLARWMKRSMRLMRGRSRVRRMRWRSASFVTRLTFLECGRRPEPVLLEEVGGGVVGAERGK